MEPDFTAQIEARLERGDWTGYWAVDLLGKASDSDLEAFQFTDVHPSNRYNRSVYFKQFTEFQTYHHVSVRRRMDDWTFWAGIRNLFDDDPPALSGNEGFRIGYGALNAYDFRGRRLFIQIDRTF